MNSEKIKELRKKAEANQEEFAELLGVSRLTISKWERGDTNPKPKHIKILKEIAEVVEEMDLAEMFKHFKSLGSKPASDNPIRCAVDNAKKTYYTECKRLGCNPKIGIMKGAMKSPFIPCWKLNEGKNFFKES